MREDYKEKIEQGKEFAEEHKAEIKKGLLYLAVAGVGAYFGIKIERKVADKLVSERGFRKVVDYCDAGATSLICWIQDNVPESFDILEKHIKKNGCNIKGYYLKQPAVVDAIKKCNLKVS